MGKEDCPRAGHALLALHQVQLLGAIKSWFVCQSLNFFLHLAWWQLLF
jgi:hypothetical protein